MSRSQANAREISRELSGAVEHAGEQRTRRKFGAEARAPRLRLRDEEDLEEFAGKYLGMAIHAGPTESQGAPSFATPAVPSWFGDSFSVFSNPAKARAIYARLIEANNRFRGASAILVALHSPLAVACDGKRAVDEEELERMRSDPTFRVRQQLSVGRRLAIYCFTETAALASSREKALAVDVVARALASFHGSGKKRGPKGTECFFSVGKLFETKEQGRNVMATLTAIANAKTAAKGSEADVWREIDKQATALVESAIRAWNESPKHFGKRQRMRTGKLEER